MYDPRALAKTLAAGQQLPANVQAGMPTGAMPLINQGVASLSPQQRTMMQAPGMTPQQFMPTLTPEQQQIGQQLQALQPRNPRPSDYGGRPLPTPNWRTPFMGVNTSAGGAGPAMPADGGNNRRDFRGVKGF
jgi:hypothetical protein